MPNYTEDDIQNALSAVRSGLSVRKAAAQSGIPRTTIQDRMSGSHTRIDAYEPRQRLSQKDESALVTWIVAQSSLNVPITHRQLYLFVSYILAKGGDHRPLGKNWVKGFIRRHPEISFFSRVQLPAVQGIPARNQYNMDETGVHEGQGTNSLIIGSAEIRVIIRKQPGSRSWTTIIECISADGRTLSPLVIFKGASVQQQWFPDKCDKYHKWHFTTSPNGWTSDEIGLAWLREVFIPETAPTNPKEPRLLIVDGHGSHTTDDFMLECFKNKIYLLFLPEHSSHVLQPLDVGVFSSVKASYRTFIMDLQLSTPLLSINKITFLDCYDKARNTGITKGNILSGWRATGIYPTNMSRPLLSKSLKSATQPLKEITQETPQMCTKQQNDLLQTPQRGSQIFDYIPQLLRPKDIDPTARQLFRKIRKGIDDKNMQLVEAEQKIQSLQRQIDHQKPRKKRKVIHDPNRKFANIKDVEKTRQRLQRRPPGPSIADGVNFESLCNEWKLDS
ncbi:transposase [Pochonia chlamydosporia 170]|uniref:Transposase n=1 Tax=Pochonia chlamydosporia 170 TaxID=1380566 RepID=A0A179EX22_METCM|nr:transposase [Pochonia chlamydosporia 170]OAQ57469.2 transposase [Pochonia chlamydosporia 170]